MDVADVVNNKAESEGKLVSWIGERSRYLLVVGGAFVVAGVGEHAC